MLHSRMSTLFTKMLTQYSWGTTRGNSTIWSLVSAQTRAKTNKIRRGTGWNLLDSPNLSLSRLTKVQRRMARWPANSILLTRRRRRRSQTHLSTNCYFTWGRISINTSSIGWRIWWTKTNFTSHRRKSSSSWAVSTEISMTPRLPCTRWMGPKSTKARAPLSKMMCHSFKFTVKSESKISTLTTWLHCFTKDRNSKSNVAFKRMPLKKWWLTLRLRWTYWWS